MSSRATAGWVIVLTGVGSLMAALDTLVVSTALSTIRVDMGASVEQLEWTVNAAAGSYASTAAFTDGFAPAIGLTAALSLAGAAAGLALPGRGQRADLRPQEVMV